MEPTAELTHKTCDHRDTCQTCHGVRLMDLGYLFFTEEIDEETATGFRQLLLKMVEDRKAQVRPGLSKGIKIFLDSPGGEVSAGMAMFAAVKSAVEDGFPVHVHVQGGAFSAAAILLQAGSHRTMSPVASMLIHGVRGGIIGRQDEVDDMAKSWNDVSDLAWNIIAERSGHKDAAWWRRFVHRKERWLTAREALDLKLIDAIVW